MVTRLMTSVKAFEDDALVVVDGLQLPGVRGEVLGPDRPLVDQRPDQAAGDVADHGLRLEQVVQDEGLEADAAVDHQLGKKLTRATFTSSPAATSSRSAWRMSGRFWSSCEGTPTLSGWMFRS